MPKRIRSGCVYLKEKQEYTAGMYWMSIERNEYFGDEVAVMVVKIPRKEHNKPEVIEAKEKEMNNIEKYGTFEEVPDRGERKITRRWVVTRKTKQDRQK